MGVLPALKFESLMQVGEQNYACFLREIISSSGRTTDVVLPAPTNE